jgi:hypothetical protein
VLRDGEVGGTTFAGMDGRAEPGIHGDEASDSLSIFETASKCLSIESATSIEYRLTSFGIDES